MTTIGYGDVAPVKGFGRVVAGTAVYTLTVSVIADWFLSTSIRRSLGTAPFEKQGNTRDRG